MGQKCIIKSCTNKSYKKGNIKLMFHRFPTNAIYRDNWILNIQVLANQIGRISDTAVICSEHFEKDAYIQMPDGKRRLSRTAEPILFRPATQSCSDNFVKIEKLYSPLECARAPLSVIQAKSSDHDRPLKNGSSRISGPGSASIPDSVRNNCNDESERKPVFVPADTSPSATMKASSIPVAIHDNKTMSSGLNIMPDNCDRSTASENVISVVKVHRVRYPGDIHDVATMSRKQLENCVRICKSKVEQQATTIKSLKRQVKAKNRQIMILRGLMKEIKTKYALSEHAAESIEVIPDFAISAIPAIP